jgi:excisionase family DNA binding protein
MKIDFEPHDIKALATMIKDMVMEDLKPYLIQNKQPDIHSILNSKQAASYLNVTEEWIRDKARAGKMPCFKTGKTYKFKQRDLDRVLKAGAPIAIMN